jgi:exodeoxyribonuclease VII large subunit
MLHVDHLARRLVHPGARLQAQSDRVQQLRARLGQASDRILVEHRWRIALLLQRSKARLPKVDELSARLARTLSLLRSAARSRIEQTAADCERLGTNLAHLDPNAVLKRGYSVVRDASGLIVRQGIGLTRGDLLDITFSEGGASARVEQIR